MSIRVAIRGKSGVVGEKEGKLISLRGQESLRDIGRGSDIIKRK